MLEIFVRGFMQLLLQTALINGPTSSANLQLWQLRDLGEGRNCDNDVVKRATDGLTKSVAVRASTSARNASTTRHTSNEGCNLLRHPSRGSKKLPEVVRLPVLKMVESRPC